MKLDQSSKQMISRSSAQRGATSRAVSAIGFPRKELTTNRPDARDCFSTYSNSFALKPGLTVTRTIPASPAPNSSMIHSGKLHDQTAILSPDLKRLSKARAVRCACSKSSE
jgi:hypothetical protein